MDRLLKESIGRCIEARQAELHRLSGAIWSRPELSGEETCAHDRLVHFFSREDSWTVEKHYKLPTAFRASWGPRVEEEVKEEVLNVAFLCEYDALPGIGHACGHNLIAEVGVASALGLKAALEQSDRPPPVKITVLGTPAEETVGGKIDLIEAGAFADIDLVLMAHPAQKDAALQPTLAVLDISVKYHGKACHASAYPWNGVNALDAAVLAYNNISVLRQQLRPEWRIQGIIKHGGEKSNIIPAYTELHYNVRTTWVQELPELRAKVEACFKAAADATGCQVELSYPGHIYFDILPNPTLEALYKNNGKSLGIQFPEQPGKFSGSTDFGNVSHIIPGIHPFFYIGTDAMNHTEEYTEAAGAEKAQSYALRTAKALAMTAVDVVCSPDLLAQVREDFRLATLKTDNFDTPRDSDTRPTAGRSQFPLKASH